MDIIPNTQYDKSVLVQHKKDGNWYYLIHTSNKMAFYEDTEGNKKRMSLSSVTDVKSVTDTKEIPKHKQTKNVDIDPMFHYSEFVVASDPELVNGNQEMFI